MILKRRGISPIIATIVLIAIVLAAAFIVYAAIGRFSSPGTIVKLDIIAKEAYTSPDGSEAFFKIVLKNSGTVSVTVTAINASLKDSTDQTKIAQLISNTLRVDAGRVVEFTGTVTPSAGAQFIGGESVKFEVKYKGPDGIIRTLTDYIELVQKW